MLDEFMKYRQKFFKEYGRDIDKWTKEQVKAFQSSRNTVLQVTTLTDNELSGLIKLREIDGTQQAFIKCVGEIGGKICGTNYDKRGCGNER